MVLGRVGMERRKMKASRFFVTALKHLAFQNSFKWYDSKAYVDVK